MGSSTIRQYREQGGIYEMWSGPGGGTVPSTNFAEMLEDRAKKTFSPRELRKTSNELLWQSALSYEDELEHLQGMSVLIDCLREAATNRPLVEVCSNALSRSKAGDKAGDDDLLLYASGQTDDVAFAVIRQAFSASGSSLVKSLNKIQTIEANRALVITAIALRRHRIALGKYPPELAALVPEYLPAPPRDPVDAKPLRYRLQPEGRFLLYSVGENGVDDGGDASPPTNSAAKRFPMMKGRDWVWPQPATSEEINAWDVKELPRN